MMGVSSTTRVVASRNVTVLRLQQQTWMSTTSTAPVMAPRSVVSRRVWQAHLEKMPKQPKVTDAKVKPDDKPWPRNIKIGAGVAASILIPYTTIWLITSNPTWRETIGSYLPLDQLRTHFGSLEWDAQSFADQGDPIPASCYQYPLELSFRDRLQQSIIEQAEKGMTIAKIYLLGDSQQQEQIKKVPASAKANPETLASLVGAHLEPGVKVAVVFEDPDKDDDNVGISQDEWVALEEERNQDNTPIKSLLKETVTYSTWYYNHMAAAQDPASAKRTSDTEIDRLRLEYTVKTLEKDLRDPTCTRDHDEMRAELKQAKSDLSRLKWKRRLGF